MRKFYSIYGKEAGSKMLAFLLCFQGKYPRNELPKSLAYINVCLGISKAEIWNNGSEDAIIVKNSGKSFHADTYVFDSKPELQLFLQLLNNERVKQTYFTGMFTADQTDFCVPYVDPESNRLRKYYLDFLVEMEAGNYLILEVKGDHMMDDPVVKAKRDAAEEIAVESSMKYEILKGTDIMEGKVKIE